MESEEKLFTLYLLLLIWLHVSAQHPCAPDEMLKGGECQPCPVCQDGQQLSAVCGYGSGAGAECVSCPPDHYSNTDSNHRCRRCSNCTALNAEYRQLCSPGTAAVCGTCLPGHFKMFRHCHPCTAAPSDNQYCRQWLSDHQMAQKTTPQPDSGGVNHNQSFVILVVSSVCGVTVIVVIIVVAGVLIAKKLKCSSCRSSRRKNRVPQKPASEDPEHVRLVEVSPTGQSTQQAIPDQPAPAYTDDPSVICNGANHIASVSYNNEQNNGLTNQTMANGNIASRHANGNIPYRASGSVTSRHVTNPGGSQIGDIPHRSEAPSEVGERLVTDTENLQGAEPYTSLLPSTRTLQHSEGSAATNPSLLTSVSSSAMVTATRSNSRCNFSPDTPSNSRCSSSPAAPGNSRCSYSPDTPGNSRCSTSPAPVDHSIPAFPIVSAQVPAGNDLMSNALPYGIQNYHSAETAPIRVQESPRRPAHDGAPFLQSSAQDVASRSLLQGETLSSAPPDGAIHPPSSLAGAISNSSDMEDIYQGLSSATNVSSLDTEDGRPKSLLSCEQSVGPLPEADGAPSTDSDQSSEEGEPSRNRRSVPGGDSFASAVGGDHSDGGRELSVDQSGEGSGEDTDPKRTQREDGRNREAAAPVVEVPESQESNRQTISNELRELMDKASNLQTGVKVAELDGNTREKIALLLNPEPSSLGVHKNWRHFAREFKIEGNLIRNWHGLCDVLMYLETTLRTVPEVLQALFQINRLDALEELCKVIIER